MGVSCPVSYVYCIVYGYRDVLVCVCVLPWCVVERYGVLSLLCGDVRNSTAVSSVWRTM